MKRIAIALLATAAALAASSARADTRVSIGVNVGGPSYRLAPPAVVHSHSHARGYWKEIQVKTWVPERWVVRHNRWGRPERYCEPGYFSYRTDRVWVDGRGRDGQHDNHRDYSYGYNNRDHRGWNR